MPCNFLIKKSRKSSKTGIKTVVLGATFLWVSYFVSNCLTLCQRVLIIFILVELQIQVALAAELPLFTKGDGIKTDAGIVDDIEDKV